MQVPISELIQASFLFFSSFISYSLLTLSVHFSPTSVILPYFLMYFHVLYSIILSKLNNFKINYGPHLIVQRHVPYGLISPLIQF